MQFTADMEEELDERGRRQVDWHKVITRLLRPVCKGRWKRRKTASKRSRSRIRCPTSRAKSAGAMMVYKMGRYRQVPRLPQFPRMPQHHGAVRKRSACTAPSAAVRAARARSAARGRKFYGCEHYPECDFVSWDTPGQRQMPGLRQSTWCSSAAARRTHLCHVCTNETCKRHRRGGKPRCGGRGITISPADMNELMPLYDENGVFYHEGQCHRRGSCGGEAAWQLLKRGCEVRAL